MTSTLPTSELAYAAGFFDGEGYVGVGASTTAGKKQYYIRVSIGQKSTPVLDWLVARWGGATYKYQSKSCSEWIITTKKARTFLAAVQPHLIVKKSQVDYLLKAWEEGRPLTIDDQQTLRIMKKG